MLCISHLSEHDQYLEKQLHLQKQLANLWENYQTRFNEDKWQKELDKLKNKLEKYRQLKEAINHVLGINQFNDSMEDNDKFQRLMQTVQDAIREEDQTNVVPSKFYYSIEKSK